MGPRRRVRGEHPPSSLWHLRNEQTASLFFQRGSPGGRRASLTMSGQVVPLLSRLRHLRRRTTTRERLERLHDTSDDRLGLFRVQQGSLTEVGRVLRSVFRPSAREDVRQPRSRAQRPLVEHSIDYAFPIKLIILGYAPVRWTAVETFVEEPTDTAYCSDVFPFVSSC